MNSRELCATGMTLTTQKNRQRNGHQGKCASRVSSTSSISKTGQKYGYRLTLTHTACILRANGGGYFPLSLFLEWRCIKSMPHLKAVKMSSTSVKSCLSRD